MTRRGPFGLLAIAFLPLTLNGRTDEATYLGPATMSVAEADLAPHSGLIGFGDSGLKS
jgi:hypothetical protein